MFAAPDPATHFVPTAPSVRTRPPESSHTRGHGEQQPEMESARQQLHQSAAQQVTTLELQTKVGEEFTEKAPTRVLVGVFNQEKALSRQT